MQDERLETWNIKHVVSSTLKNEQIRVLLIEDNPGDARLIHEMLKEINNNQFKLVHVKRLGEGLDRLHNNSFDVILLDLGLQDSQGLSTLKEVYNNKPDSPIVVLTGLADEIVGVKAVHSGAQDYLIKGEVDSKLLIRSINYAIERKHAEESLHKVNRALKTLSDCNEVLVRATNELELYQNICQNIVRIGEYRFACVGLTKNSGEKCEHVVACAGYKEGTLEIEESKWIASASLCSIASEVIKTGEYSIYEDIVNTPKYKYLQSEAIKYGYESFIVIPLHYNNKTIGVLSIYAVEVDRFDTEEVKLLTELANDLAYGIRTLKARVKREIAEKNLLESEKKYRTTFESTGTATVIIEEDTTLSIVNSQFEKLSGYSKEELEGKKSWTEFVAEEDLPRMKEYHIKRRENKDKTPNQYEFQFVDRYGNIKDIFLTIAMIPGTKKSIASLLDITERNRTRRELRKQKEFSESLIKSMQDGLSVLDTEGIHIDVNPALCRMTGFSKDELIGTGPPYPYWPPELHDEIKEAFEKTRRCDFENFELTFMKKNGERFPVILSPFHIKDIEGNTINYAATIKDISELKIAEEEKEKIRSQLLQSQKMEAIGRLAGGIAHDFNNLLTVIIGYTELLIDDFPMDDPRRKDIEEIHKAGKSASLIARQLLAFSRRQEIQPRELNINSIVKDIEKMLKHLIGEDIKLFTVLEQKPHWIKADPGQLEQVLINLAVNAREAMPEGGELTIKIENIILNKNDCIHNPESRPGKFILMSVVDTGVGMNEKTQANIFEPFFTTKENGTGLGLSVVYGIIRQHEGWIEVLSSPRKGTTFKIYLPACQEKELDEDMDSISVEDLKGNGEGILLVEDNDFVLEFCSRLLWMNGYKVYEAKNLKSAINTFKMKKDKINLVFTDVVLPDGNGVLLVEKLLNLKKEIRILLSSGYTAEKSNTPIIQLRGYNFIQKPYSVVNLLKTIKEVLNE